MNIAAPAVYSYLGIVGSHKQYTLAADTIVRKRLGQGQLHLVVGGQLN